MDTSKTIINNAGVPTATNCPILTDIKYAVCVCVCVCWDGEWVSHVMSMKRSTSTPHPTILKKIFAFTEKMFLLLFIHLIVDLYWCLHTIIHTSWGCCSMIRFHSWSLIIHGLAKVPEEQSKPFLHSVRVKSITIRVKVDWLYVCRPNTTPCTEAGTPNT